MKRLLAIAKIAIVLSAFAFSAICLMLIWMVGRGIRDQEWRREHQGEGPEPEFSAWEGRSSIYGPVFVGSGEDEEYPAGTSFATRVDGHLLLLTAYHLLGPDGGWDDLIAPEEIPSRLRAIRIPNQDLLIPGRAWVPVSSVAPLSPFALGETAEAGDFLAFRLPEDSVHRRVLELSETAPQQGDWVWVLMPWRAIPARVTSVNDHEIEFDFDDPDTEISGTSGAPVVDTEGRVLGIQLGGWPGQGIANPVTHFLPPLRRALSPLVGEVPTFTASEGCALGSSGACFREALGQVETGDPRGLETLRVRCEHTDLRACGVVAWCEGGRTLPLPSPDDLQMACEADDALSCLAFVGDQSPKAAAVSASARACALGRDDGCQWAVLLHRLTMMQRSDRLEVGWPTLVCEAERPWACVASALGDEDQARALEHLLVGCAAGIAEGCELRGERLRDLSAEKDAEP